jgi:uncharacterized protein DUF1707
VAFWALIGRLATAMAERDATLVGDRDRELAAVSLREHYAGGYLTLDELSRRTGTALTARSRGELRRALSGLSVGASAAPPARSARSLAAVAARVVVLVVFVVVYVVFAFALWLLSQLWRRRAARSLRAPFHPSRMR